MKLAKAIEILEYHEPSITYDENPDIREALKLGIEALKRQLAKGTLTFAAMMLPLPGETEE